MSVLTINKLTESVGASVEGVDSDRLAGDDTLAAAITGALEDNGVLVFHGLRLEPEAQVAFCSRLGEVDRSSDGHHPVSGIYPITLDKSKNASADYLKATFDWHIDGCTPLHDECPQKATVLSAIQVASRGGETEFANSYAAYEDLTDAEKERYCSLRVVHSLEASQRRVWPDPPAEMLARWRSRPTHEHPLVWTHRSGRKSLDDVMYGLWQQSLDSPRGVGETEWEQLAEQITVLNFGKVLAEGTPDAIRASAARSSLATR